VKITFFINEISGGGAERVACNLANHLSMKGIDINILTLNSIKVRYPLSTNINVYSLVNEQYYAKHKKSIVTKIIYYIKLFKELNKYIKKSNTDCYIVFLPIATCLLLLYRNKIKVPIIASERSAPWLAYKPLMQKILKRLCSKADMYVFQTEEVKNWYKPHLKNSKYSIIPNPINDDFLVKRYTGIRRKCIVTVGRLDPVKNHELLINAFHTFSTNHDDYILEIYGEGDDKSKLEKLVNNLNLNTKVKFEGNVTDLGNKIISASLFVLTSNYEGMPNALSEAMALGLPCISTDCPVGGPRFLIKSNVNGILIPVGNSDILIEKMNSVIDDPVFAEYLGNNARDIQNTLSPQRIYGEWERIIDNLINYSQQNIKKNRLYIKK
jgi:glycosyltransferase involved in cell wall biosynthesis